MIVRLAHLCIKTNRFEESVAFYRDLIGLPVKFTLDLPNGKPFGYYFELGGTSFLELFDQAGAADTWGGDHLRLVSHPDQYFHHFCLQVEGLDALRKDLSEKGLPITDISVGMDGSRQCWIKDPDGNDIELMEYTPQSMQLR